MEKIPKEVRERLKHNEELKELNSKLDILKQLNNWKFSGGLWNIDNETVVFDSPRGLNQIELDYLKDRVMHVRTEKGKKYLVDWINKKLEMLKFYMSYIYYYEYIEGFWYNKGLENHLTI